MSANQIAKISAARRALGHAKSVDSVKKVIALTDGILAAARKLLDKGGQIEAAEVRFRAMRRLGEMIEAQKRTFGLAKGGRPPKTGSKSNPVSKPLTLSEAGIEKRLAHESRQLSRMSEYAFETFLTNWRKRSELAKGRVTTTLTRPTAKDTKGEQTVLFEPSSFYLSWNGQKLERVRSKNASAPDWLRLADTADSMIGMIAVTIKKLNRIASRIDDRGSIEKFQKTFDKLAADISELSEQYWLIRNLLAQSKSEGGDHAQPEYDPELERRGLWPPDKTDDAVPF